MTDLAPYLGVPTGGLAALAVPNGAWAGVVGRAMRARAAISAHALSAAGASTKGDGSAILDAS